MAYFSDLDSDTDYGYDLTVSDEEALLETVRRIEEAALAPRPAPAPAARSASSRPDRRPSPPVALTGAAARNDRSAPRSGDEDSLFAQRVDQTLVGLEEDDLNFSLSDLDDQDSFSPDGRHGRRSNAPRSAGGELSTPPMPRMAPSVDRAHDRELARFVSATRPRRVATVLPDPHDSHPETPISYPDLSRALYDVEQQSEASSKEGKQKGKQDGKAKSPVDGQTEDELSPLRRFRTAPMKPFSVSDLTASAWCELQHYFTLTRLGGRKTKTAAMKQGTAVHEKLERQIHVPVAVDVAKTEDSFGVRLWNIVAGLRTLRRGGLTRELEVWGFIDGNLVNGIIDSLSYDNPDPGLEEEVTSRSGSSQGQATPPPSTPQHPQIYVTDVKTRASASLPSKQQERGTKIQLFLYHRFLSEMAAGRFDYEAMFKRYGLNLDEPFSDGFLAQIHSLHNPHLDKNITITAADSPPGSWVDDDASSDKESEASFASAVSSPPATDAEPVFPNLRSMIPLMESEFRLTFPHGADDLGNIVAVEYRYRSRASSEQDDASAGGVREAAGAIKEGSVITTNTFFVQPQTLDLFLTETMRWWRGEREPVGVLLEDSFKCRYCEFAASCDWRSDLDDEARRRERDRKEARIAAASIKGKRGGGGGGRGGGDGGGSAPTKNPAATGWETSADADADTEESAGARKARAEGASIAIRGKTKGSTPRKSRKAVDAVESEATSSEGWTTRRLKAHHIAW